MSFNSPKLDWLIICSTKDGVRHEQIISGSANPNEARSIFGEQLAK